MRHTQQTIRQHRSEVSAGPEMKGKMDCVVWEVYARAGRQRYAEMRQACRRSCNEKALRGHGMRRGKIKEASR